MAAPLNYPTVCELMFRMPSVCATMCLLAKVDEALYFNSESNGHSRKARKGFQKVLFRCSSASASNGPAPIEIIDVEC